MPEKALNAAIDRERATAQLLKTGGTPYKFGNIEVELDEGLAVPARTLNELRRQALEAIETERIRRYSRVLPDEFVEKEIKKLYFPGNGRKHIHVTGRDINYSVFIYKFDSRQDYSLLRADRAYIPLQAIIKPETPELIEKMVNKGIRIFAWLPPVTRGNYDKMISSTQDRLPSIGLSGFIVGNLGSLHVPADKGLGIFGDYNLNVFNSFSIQAFGNLGFKGVTISPELDIERIEKLEMPVNMDVEAVVYGRLTLMTSEYCPVGALEGGFTSGKHCKGTYCSGDYRLRDRKGVEFPVLTDPIDCRSTVLNSTVLFVPELQSRLNNAGVNIMRLNMFDETVDEINEILDLYREAASDGADRRQKHSAIAEKIRAAGFTRGHYLRGV